MAFTVIDTGRSSLPLEEESTDPTVWDELVAGWNGGGASVPEEESTDPTVWDEGVHPRPLGRGRPEEESTDPTVWDDGETEPIPSFKSEPVPHSSQWVDPEVALEHEGPDGPVVVYHVYKDDDIERGRMTFWFTLHLLYCEGDPELRAFDVRELKSWQDRVERPFAQKNLNRIILGCLRKSIKTGELKRVTS